MAASNKPSPGRKSDKLWRDALMMSARRTWSEAEELAVDDAAPLIQRAAAQVMLKAASGDRDAYKEVGDRIDGKPHASVDVTTTHERPASEWTEHEIDAAIERARAAGVAAGKAAKAPSAEKPGRVH